MTARILHLIESLGPSSVARQLTLAAAGLNQTEFASRVATLRAARPESNRTWTAELVAAGVTVYDCGGRWPVDPRVMARLGQLLRTWQPDVIHTWDAASAIYAHLALTGVSKVAHVTSRRTWLGGSRIPRTLDNLVVRSAAALITSSEVLAAEWRKRGTASDKLRVIASGVRPAAPPCTTRAQLLAELGLPGPVRLMGCIGELTVDKRIKDVIWAADLLKVVRDDVHLLIIGDGPHRARLERFRDQVRIADKVHFLGERSDVPRQ